MNYAHKHQCTDLVSVDLADDKAFGIITFELAALDNESSGEPHHVAIALPMHALCGLRDFLAQLPLQRPGGLN